MVARRLGGGLQRFDRLVASWGLLELEAGPGPGQDGPIHIEAMPDGWWYAARLPGGRLSVVRFAEGAVREPEPFLGALREARHVAALLEGDGWRWVRPPSAWPAHSARLEQVCGPGWFAVGDAAGCFDPLSSYGIGSAMGTGFYAAQALVDAWRGEPETGEAYRWLLEDRYQRYLATLGERYSAVSRWPEAPFWSRGRGRA
jgi:flavin-dependent dehydrogenase